MACCCALCTPSVCLSVSDNLDRQTHLQFIFYQLSKSIFQVFHIIYFMWCTMQGQNTTFCRFENLSYLCSA